MVRLAQADVAAQVQTVADHMLRQARSDRQEPRHRAGPVMTSNDWRQLQREILNPAAPPVQPSPAREAAQGPPYPDSTP